MATLKIPNGNGGWVIVTDPTALHIDEPISDITIGTVGGTNYEQKINGKTLVITNTEEDSSNNISIGDGDIIPCTSEGLFGSKGYAYAVLRAGGQVYKSNSDTYDPTTATLMDISEATANMYAKPSVTYTNSKGVEIVGDNIYYYVVTGQVDTTEISGFNTFSFANGSALGNYTIAGGRGCFALAGKGIDPSRSKHSVSIGYESVSTMPDDILLGTRNYAFNYKGAYTLGSSNVFEMPEGAVDSNGNLKLNCSNGWIIGYNGTIKADSAANIGIYNNNNHENTYTFGRHLTTAKEKQMLLGWNAKLSDGGAYNTFFAVGDGDDTTESTAFQIYKNASTLRSSHAYLYCGLGIGKNPTVAMHKSSLAVGDDTSITGNNSIGSGAGVKSTDNNMATFGKYNKTQSGYRFVLGNGTSDSDRHDLIRAKDDVVYIQDTSLLVTDWNFGSNVSSANLYSMGVGYGVRLGRSNQLLVGKFPEASTTAIFGVGNGTSNSNSGRNLIFSVEANKVTSTNPIYVNNKEVATKEYVASVTTGLGEPSTVLCERENMTVFGDTDAQTITQLYLSDHIDDNGWCMVTIECDNTEYTSPLFYYNGSNKDTDFTFTFYNVATNTFGHFRLLYLGVHDLYAYIDRGGIQGMSTATIKLYKIA